MAIRNILKEDDQRLRKKSRAVTEFNERLWTLLDDMYETMVDEGVGLAAPQVGVLRQAVVIDVGEGKWELVNPEIVSEEGEQCDTEGCLSIPGVWGVVRRPKKLHICAQDRFGKPFEFDAEDFFAVACCHEIDHLSGVLFTDRAERLLTPDELREAE
ncbi:MULTISPECIES: peptide deformylase [unclassified Anaerotruncus]|jgi:peptide deformylase|uniref:peptide deformylase n=1 Tax=unclassified Anaerotruncus TaxID=2641626 RepID=UPI000336F8F0|nr:MULTISPECIES: peptide deformylase [unclassified Anaerotruncus]MCI9160026.1 peptide deformylase [Anaerotruncus sp.]NCE75590.1 peptide deformylase [Anaerotruncus sp. X29]RKJ88953.1 peptide deformylase [Anaerotruncus sp. 1XD22-93]EOS62727.1 peptide deformylase [Anaerotruncus sp. G3(2012)]MCI9235172.1 peptide deformylase [Anaerotruncus sp.]